jgi:hypothetical protein
VAPAGKDEDKDDVSSGAAGAVTTAEVIENLSNWSWGKATGLRVRKLFYKSMFQL